MATIIEDDVDAAFEPRPTEPIRRAPAPEQWAILLKVLVLIAASAAVGALASLLLMGSTLDRLEGRIGLLEGSVRGVAQKVDSVSEDLKESESKIDVLYDWRETLRRNLEGKMGADQSRPPVVENPRSRRDEQGGGAGSSDRMLMSAVLSVGMVWAVGASSQNDSLRAALYERIRGIEGCLEAGLPTTAPIREDLKVALVLQVDGHFAGVGVSGAEDKNLLAILTRCLNRPIRSIALHPVNQPIEMQFDLSLKAAPYPEGSCSPTDAVCIYMRDIEAAKRDAGPPSHP